MRTIKGECVCILASTSVPFTLTTVQVLNLALTDTKRITVLENYDRSKIPEPHAQGGYRGYWTLSLLNNAKNHRT
jgi:hypothetical protein